MRATGNGVTDAAPWLTHTGGAVAAMTATAGVVHSPSTVRSSRVRLSAKRLLDIAGSCALLAVLGIPMLALALWIRRDSPGPALFRQPRAGLNGRTFHILKFRTMTDGADHYREQLREHVDADEVLFKLEEDPRVTRAGRWLRRFSFDELPQLINVLRGEMSLVGPRPHPLDDVARYDDHAWGRLAVKPGLTGAWQVSGRSTLSWSDGLAIDLHYVHTWTIARDLAILARTPVAVVTCNGAY